MEFEAISLNIEGPIARVVLSRPEAGNGIDARFLRELDAACEQIAASEGISLVLITANGRDFCTGWDEATREALARDPNAIDPFGGLARLPCPVIAAVHGNISGAGLELALACDVRIARNGARFSIPDVAEGNVTIAGGSARLPRIAGRTVAAAMLLLGDELDAEAASRAGIVSRVLPASTFETETEALASRMAANGPIALRYAKELIHNGTELPLDHALRYELDLSVILQTTRDRAEGVEAFLQKRAPDFENR